MAIIVPNLLDCGGFLCLVSATLAQEQHLVLVSSVHKRHKSTIEFNCGTGVKSQAWWK